MTVINKPVLALRPQHSCFVYEDNDAVVTIWSKKKKRMRSFEANTWLDIAKADLMERMRS